MSAQTALVMEQRDASIPMEADENGDCSVINNVPEARSILRVRWGGTCMVRSRWQRRRRLHRRGDRWDEIAFYRCVVLRQVRLGSTDHRGKEEALSID